MSALSERYRERARECRRLANETGDDVAADHLILMAESLEEAAAEEEQASPLQGG